MTESRQPPEMLAHWIYTSEEWNIFRRWKIRQKSRWKCWLYPVYSFFSWKTIAVPEVIITPEKILEGAREIYFSGNKQKMQRIDILDAGMINIISFTWTLPKGKAIDIFEYFLPVPRGKLREAIQVQDYFTGSG